MNELSRFIDFEAIAKETGIAKGKIFFSEKDVTDITLMIESKD